MDNSEGSNHGLFIGEAVPYPVCYCLVCGAFLSAPHLCQYCPKRSGSARPHRAAGYGPKALPFYVSLGDRKSTRLNSSHVASSYAVFCLKKKIKQNILLHP